jgi:hypothetical protein
MTQVVYVPSQCKDSKDDAGNLVPASFSGQVLVRPPTFGERCDYLEGVTLIEGPEAIVNIRRAKYSVACAEKHVESVSLKRLSDGKEYSSFESLSIDGSCVVVLSDIARALMDGSFLGNG